MFICLPDSDVDANRVEAEEDLDALQEQTFSRVQHMQEQITGPIVQYASFATLFF